MTTSSVALNATADNDLYSKCPRVKAYSLPKRIAGYGPENWVLLDCPFCGSTHVHGAAPGSRVPHCGKGTGEYVLEYAGPLPEQYWYPSRGAWPKGHRQKWDRRLRNYDPDYDPKHRARGVYDPKFCDLARRMGADGATYPEIAAVIGVRMNSLLRWQATRPEFYDALEPAYRNHLSRKPHSRIVKRRQFLEKRRKERLEAKHKEATIAP
jgi:hypothetical protein